MKTNLDANPSTEIRLAYEAAAAMLARQDVDSLRYAALELRRCIEAIVYEKLKVYDSLLPGGSIHRLGSFAGRPVHRPKLRLSASLSSDFGDAESTIAANFHSTPMI